MIIYFKGTVFNAEADAIVNTVNCSGVMGAGLALEFSLRYPNMFEDYRAKCQREEIKVGRVSYYREKEKVIINFPTKWHFKYPSKIEWIRSALNDFVHTYKAQGIQSVAFPKLGTLNGGLEWGQVRAVMEQYLRQVDIPVYICLDEDPACGLEKQMLEIFNDLSIEKLKRIVRLTEGQKKALSEGKPFSRFWQIKQVEGIGITTYQKIFLYCKDLAEGGEEQLTLF